MEIENLITTKEAAKLLGIKKSRLNYFVWLDLFKPVKVINSQCYVFDKEETLRVFNRINELQESGISLKEIAKLNLENKL